MENSNCRHFVCALAGFAVVLTAAAADAGNVTGLRVGLHPEFVRVVVQTDEFVEYSFEVQDPPAGEPILVRLEAQSRVRSARPPGARTPTAEIEPLPGGGSLLRIYPPGPVVIEQEVIGDPPRIVLDLRDPPAQQAAVVAAKPALPVPIDSEVSVASPVEEVKSREPFPAEAPVPAAPVPTLSAPERRDVPVREVAPAPARQRAVDSSPLPGVAAAAEHAPLGLSWRAWSLLVGSLTLAFCTSVLAFALVSFRRPAPEAPVVGPIGPSGELGPRGPAGELGSRGEVGPAGEAGPRGEAGAAGEAGPRGEAGPCGEVGPGGESGPRGEAGPPGAPGAIGVAGTPGPLGSRGEAGPGGAVGSPGEPGPAGVVGNAGPAGPAGPRGGPGPPGPAGAQGTAGPPGSRGEAGLPGPPGPAGDLGRPGQPGAAGEPGPRGPAGEAGASGLTGKLGEAGPAGPRGEAGDIGPPGPRGATGRPGAVSEGGAPLDQQWVADLLHVFQGLDARVALLEDRQERQLSEGQRLSDTGQAVAQELRAQRVALARLQRALSTHSAPPATRWRRPGDE